MEEKQRKNLAKTAIALLESYRAKGNTATVKWNGRTYDFDMSEYSDAFSFEINECGTNCCFAGFGGLVFPEDAKEIGNWVTFSRVMYGCSATVNPRTFDFLFGTNWEDDPRQAARRALYFLLNNVGEYDYQDFRPYASKSNKWVIKELEKFA